MVLAEFFRTWWLLAIYAFILFMAGVTPMALWILAGPGRQS